MRIASSCALLLVLATTRAGASPADDEFKRGRDLVKAGNYAEACAAFEKSQQLDPSFGTQFNIAQCDEKIGKLATALGIYRDLAAHDTNDNRRAASADLAQKLAPRVPIIRVQLDAQPPGLVVTVADKPVVCTPACADVPVDYGTYSVVARAPGYADATSSTTISDESKTVVQLHLVASTASPTTTATKSEIHVEPSPTSSHRKRNGMILLGGGGGVLAAGLVVGVLARSKWNDAKDVCGGSTTCPTDAETARANDLLDAARTRAAVATALVAVGGVAIAAGVVLYVTAPSERAQVAVQTGGSSTALVFSGHF